MKTWLLMVALLAALTLAGCASEGLRIAEQGSFAVGGTVVKAPGEFDFAHPTRTDGRTLHGDHAAVSYQIPVDAKAIPLVFLSGFGQTSRCWDTTPDGREGWRTTFLRRGWPVYLVDQPRRGSAGRTTVAAMPATVPDDQLWLENFRIHAGAFPEGEAAMDQFLRWMTPDTGPIDGTLVADSLVALTQKIGPAVLFTHSQGGIFGWAVPGRGGKVASIVAIEPGAFPFPKGEVPVPIPNSSPFTPIKPVPLEAKDFTALCRVPILVLFGDGIASEPSETDWPGDGWRARLEQGRKFVDCAARHGGDVTLVHLPEVGIRGNTHFPFADTNSEEVAAFVADWLRTKGLD